MIQKRHFTQLATLLTVLLLFGFILANGQMPVVYAGITPTPTAVPVEPTSTPVPPTAVPATATPIPPTAVPATNTPAPQEPQPTQPSSGAVNTPVPTPVLPQEIPELGYGPSFATLFSIAALFLVLLGAAVYTLISRIFFDKSK